MTNLKRGSNDYDQTVLICCRVAEIDPPVNSTVDSCSTCGKAVWRALSSPEVDLILCMQCGEAQIGAAKAADKKVEFGVLTDEQRKDIHAHRMINHLQSQQSEATKFTTRRKKQ
jgi:hypothetical protein